MANKPENFICNLYSEELKVLIHKKLSQIKKNKTRVRLEYLLLKSKVIKHVRKNTN